MLAADPEAGGELSASQRTALLGAAVRDLTREARASLRSQGEFDALLVRGVPVSHGLHLVTVLVATVVALLVSQGLGLAPLSLAMLGPCLYAVYWIFLAVTGGEELDHISIDERGRLRSTKSGRAVETRSDFLRVAIPILVIAVSGPLAIWLAYMIAFPPPPVCNLGDPYALPAGCFTFPNFLGGTIGMPLSVEETQRLESLVRAFFLAVDLIFLLPATWFLRRMLTGRWVTGLRPIHRYQGDD